MQSSSTTDSGQICKRGVFGIRGFRKAYIGSNEREFCGDGLESHKDRRRRWVLLVSVKIQVVSAVLLLTLNGKRASKIQ